jgi:metal-dependent hydrolase (beta-lactamase superfamily II)
MPELHQNVRKLEHQLVKQISKAKEQYRKVVVVYGGKFCYENIDQPMRQMQQIIEEQEKGVASIQATHCIDMLASAAELDAIAIELLVENQSGG